MRKSLSILIAIGMSLISFAGNNIFHSKFQSQNNNWIEFEETFNSDPYSFLNEHKSEFGLSTEYSFAIKEMQSDNFGFDHYDFKQFYKGVEVDNAIYILHVLNGKMKHANGRLVYGIQSSNIASISKTQALNNALSHYGHRGLWENAEEEAFLKSLKKDINATYLPEPKLVYADPKMTQMGSNYTLAWKIDLYLDNPEKDHKVVYVDAIRGDFYFDIEGNHSTSAVGTAETRYSATLPIVTDSTAPTSFRLYDDTKNAINHTLDANGTSSGPGSAVEFTDSDNYWDDHSSTLDDGAYDAHIATSQFLDYYLFNHGRSSFDGQSGDITSVIHYTPSGGSWFNAQWTGSYARYGDGNNNPLTSLDVVGHELTHGVIQFTAGLVYAYEPGALNESFADIFGTAVEYYSGDPNASWLIGRANFVLRNMANPNQYAQPDTYLGTSWWTAPGDNGGVHYNSGVQNYWYYLLVSGGSGTNDIGNSFTVSALGFDKADSIAYRNLDMYLTATSQYEDAKNGAIQAATDIYGPCSNEVIQTAMAWYAVGVGADPLNNDFAAVEINSPSSNCDLGNSETVEFSFKYINSAICGNPPSVGDIIPIGYKIGTGAFVVENYVFTSIPSDGDILTHTFANPVDLSIGNKFKFEFVVDYGSTIFASNNTLISDIKTSRVYDESATISFEKWFFPTIIDSFYTVNGFNSITEINQVAKNTGSWGMQMTAGEFDPSNWNTPSGFNDNFVLNPENISKVCFCVDASNASLLKLKFDVKQTYSNYYFNFLNLNLRGLATNLRLMVNGNQEGSNISPLVNNDGIFRTKEYDLNSYLGQSLDICLEGQHIIPVQDDPQSGSPGDNTFLDNIEIIMELNSGLNSPLTDSDIHLYPNPGKTHINLIVNNSNSTEMIYEIRDLNGKLLMTRSIIEDSRIDISHLASGMYLLNVLNGNSKVVKKFTVSD